MSFWDGTRWVTTTEATPRRARSRLTDWVATAVMVIGLVALLLPLSSMLARSSYSPTLGVTFASAAVTSSSDGVWYVVAGCGYNSDYGSVTIVVSSPIAVSWTGRMPDSNGCISATNFYTVGSGHYEIDAWQQVRHKASIVASTSFDW